MGVIEPLKCWLFQEIQRFIHISVIFNISAKSRGNLSSWETRTTESKPWHKMFWPRE